MLWGRLACVPSQPLSFHTLYVKGVQRKTSYRSGLRCKVSDTKNSRDQPLLSKVRISMWNTQFAAYSSSWFSRNFFQLHLIVSDTREIIQVCVPIRLYEQTKLCNSFLYWSSQSEQVQRQKEFKNSSYPLRKEVHRNILVKDRSEGFQKHVVCPVLWVWV